MGGWEEEGRGGGEEGRRGEWMDEGWKYDRMGVLESKRMGGWESGRKGGLESGRMGGLESGRMRIW